ncbi:MAG: M14-type cytosolic carboxypeptidase [Gammaproteobacteria bacterium]|nr:M14-type cytosolic carboxypeptidase [Gammaproteobacteria bacterium]
MKVSAQFDGGNIEVIEASDPSTIRLKIRPDSQADFKQWFYFRLQGAQNQACNITIVNAGEASYLPGWEQYQAVASYDRMEWFRVATRFENGELRIDHTPDCSEVYYAYFEPYSFDRHLDLIAFSQVSPLCKVIDLGSTLEGHDISLLRIGEAGADKLNLWIIARQHSGETMAEWFMEGFLNRLLDSADPCSRQLLQKAVFYIVPNMNVDGSVKGNLRANAAGQDLNRQWLNPSMEKSPEVFVVRQKMHEVGVDFFLDVHGDEGLPYVFLAGCEGIPSYDKAHHAVEQKFKQAFMQASPELQDHYGYDKLLPTQANLSLANQYVGEQFRCLSYVLEMPFKDNANLPDSEYGWSSARSIKLGEAALQAILSVLGDLRAA